MSLPESGARACSRASLHGNLRRRGHAVVFTLVVASALAPPRLALADTTTGSAADHFHRGVSLYKDADYQGALVEFRRAQEISPNYRIYYDIGQSLYQLQRYAEALTAFEAYLSQGGGGISAVRRAAVEGDLRALRSRVGRLEITVNLDGAEIRIDDQTVGSSPLSAPVLVSVGHRKVTVVRPGRVPLEKFVDVAAGDRTKASFDFPEESAPAPAAAQAPAQSSPPPESAPAHAAQGTSPPPASPAPPPAESRSLAWIPWTATGLFAAGAAVTGALTLTTKSSLTTQLGTFPANATAIDDDRSRAKTFAGATDVLLAATAISLAVSLYVTLHSSGPAKSETGAAGNVKVGIGLGGLRLQGDF